jgi:hypothetical protein
VKPAAIVPPVAAGPNFPIVDTSPKVSTAGGRYRKPSPSVPVWAWIVGGFGVLVLFCCGGPMMLSTVTAPQREAEREAKEQRLAAELPDNSTGRQWLKASGEAKARFVEKFGPSWTYMKHSDVIESVDFHYEWAEKSLESGKSINDSAKEVIEKIVADEKQEQRDNMKEYWANRAAQEKDPAMRQEYLRRYREE